MLFQNALIENSTAPACIRVEDGTFTAIRPDLSPNPEIGRASCRERV